jgi:thiamine biosynthesis protein ThiI
MRDIDLRTDDERLFVTIRPTAEVTIKAPTTRASFLRKLRLAVKDALQRGGFGVRVFVRGNRVMAEVSSRADEGGAAERPDPAEGRPAPAEGRPAPAEGRPAAAAERPDPAAVAEVLSRVFGIGTFSLVEAVTAPDLDAIVEAGQRLYGERVRGKRYAVRCKRMGRHAFSSMDVERKLGAALNPGAKVDLTNPEVTVELEVDGRQALFLSQRHAGAGGLPLGTGGHALALLSGGYDSVVAAWSLMRRGVEVDFVHFRLGDLESERLALRVAKVLSDEWGAGSRPEAHVIDLRPAMGELRSHVETNLWQVGLKRLMVRAADGVADALEAYATAGASGAATQPQVRGRRLSRRRIDALVTGEAIGQVSSQTLSNIRTIDAAAVRPVLRPLIATDKLEIIALAERIGTAELSAKAVEECNITPVRPATSSRAERLSWQEGGMNEDALLPALARVASGASRVPLRAYREGEGVLPVPTAGEGDDLRVRELPADAVLIDCRAAAKRGWTPAWPEMIAEPSDLIAGGGLDADRVYVAFCPLGQRSAYVAKLLREGGVRAYSFMGGEGELHKYLERSAGAGAVAEGELRP